MGYPTYGYAFIAPELQKLAKLQKTENKKNPAWTKSSLNCKKQWMPNF